MVNADANRNRAAADSAGPVEGVTPPVAAESTAFVFCIEDNETSAQALLLAESIRAFGGRFAAAPLVAVAPRAGLGVDVRTRARLERLAVEYHQAPLNTVAPEYGSANRVYAAAWAAEHRAEDVLVVLDSDTLFVDEPEPLGAGWDLAVRPVDVKGMASVGPGDPCEAYWLALAELAGVPLSVVPFLETGLDAQRIRASYNGGYAQVRRATGILERTAELFTRAAHAGLRPGASGPGSIRPGEAPGSAVFSSTGPVSAVAEAYWGSNQAALAIAAWATSNRIRTLDRRTNVPLHGLTASAQLPAAWTGIAPRHVHYHWMFRDGHMPKAMAALRALGVPPDRLDWIAARTPLGPRRRAIGAASGTDERALVVLGMAASGAESVARELARAGVAIAPTADAEIARLHDAWGGGAGTPLRLAALDVPAGAATAARSLVARRRTAEQRPAWGFWEPRTLGFLDVWDAVVPECDFVVVYRHPVDVGLALFEGRPAAPTDGDAWATLRAWEAGHRRVLGWFERYPERWFVVHADAVAAAPVMVLDRLGTAFALPLALSDAVSTHDTDPGERRATPSERDSPVWEALIPEALALYRRLEEVADLPSWRLDVAEQTAAPRPAADREVLTRFCRELYRERPARVEEAWDTDPQATWQLEELRVAFAREQGRTAELAEQLGETRAYLAEATRRRDELARTLAAVESSRGHRWLTAWWRWRERLRGLTRRGADG